MVQARVSRAFGRGRESIPVLEPMTELGGCVPDSNAAGATVDEANVVVEERSGHGPGGGELRRASPGLRIGVARR